MIESGQLWILRHGVAGDKSESNTPEQDFVRALTKKGARQSVNAGRLMRRIAPRFTACYTSPMVRCVQSAVLACAELKGVKPKPKKALINISPAEATGLLEEGKAVLLVGHGPEMNDVVAHLTGRTVDMSRGTLAAVKITNGQGTLDQLLTPKQIRALVKPSRAGSGRAARSAALSLTLAREEWSRPCARRAPRRLTRRQRGTTR
jgi:phosphohistidine phosphatase